MNVAVIIPVRRQAHLTAALLSQLRKEAFDRCYILDYGGAHRATEIVCDLTMRADDRFARITCPPSLGMGALWNIGWERAEADLDSPAIVFCSTQTVISPGSIEMLAKALADRPDAWLACPDWRVAAPAAWDGTLGDAGGAAWDGGWCFACKPGLSALLGARFDTNYTVLGADADLAFRVEDAGGAQVQLNGMGITRLEVADAPAERRGDPLVLAGYGPVVAEPAGEDDDRARRDLDLLARRWPGRC